MSKDRVGRGADNLIFALESLDCESCERPEPAGNEAFDRYPVLTIPQHFFIDRKGVVRDIFVGFLDKEALLERVREL